MRHINESRTQAAVKVGQFIAQVNPQLRVEMDNGSSIRNRLGCRTMARATATRWRCPPESCAGFRPSSGWICNASATAATCPAMPRSIRPRRGDSQRSPGKRSRSES